MTEDEGRSGGKAVRWSTAKGPEVRCAGKMEPDGGGSLVELTGRWAEVELREWRPEAKPGDPHPKAELVPSRSEAELTYSIVPTVGPRD